MIEFRFRQHDLRNTQVVDILVDDKMAATLTLGDADNSIRIISAHFDTFKDMRNEDDQPATLAGFKIPYLEFSLRPRPYSIRDGKVWREE